MKPRNPAAVHKRFLKIYKKARVRQNSALRALRTRAGKKTDKAISEVEAPEPTSQMLDSIRDYFRATDTL